MFVTFKNILYRHFLLEKGQKAGVYDISPIAKKSSRKITKKWPRGHSRLLFLKMCSCTIFSGILFSGARGFVC